MDISNVADLIDDILVFGQTEQAHDTALDETFQKLEDLNLTVNEEKCEFKVKEVKFFGWIISEQGIRVDPEKLKDILEMDDPESVGQLRSLLGTTGYLLKFVPEYASTYCRTIKKDEPWKWDEIQKRALRSLKTRLTNTPVLRFFDTNFETYLWVDASPVGLGAVLLQKENGNQALRPVAFASRSLTTTESKYAQIEKEMLSLAWGNSISTW